MLNTFKTKWMVTIILAMVMMLMMIPCVLADDNSTVTISLPVANGHPVRTAVTGEPDRYEMTSIVICPHGYRIWSWG